MTPSPATGAAARDGADRCPGLLSPFVSADGAIVRLRIPGGYATTELLREVSSLATVHGDPAITLTSRGSLQVRGLPTPLPDELLTGLLATGTIPSGPHDRVRNIVCDPGDPGLRPLVEQLDAAVLADPLMAGLPGRTLLAVARPDGPVLAEPHDLAVVAAQGASDATVVVDGRGRAVPAAEAAGLAVAVLGRFLDARGDARTWNVTDLPPAARAALLPGAHPVAHAPAAPPRPGRHGDALVALVPLGMLTPAMVHALVAVSPEVQVTPWRSVVVPAPEDPERATHILGRAGLVLDPASPWTVLSACTGAPGCSRTRTPTQELARSAAAGLDPAGPPVHVVGCERACGHPARTHALSLRPTSPADVVAAQQAPHPPHPEDG